MEKIAIMLIIAKLISKAFGFVRDISLAYYFGASTISDAYLICLTIPILIFSFIGTGLATSYIPIYNKLYTEGKEETAESFTSNLANLTMVACSFIVIICFLFTPSIVKIFAFGFSDELLLTTVTFTRISVLGIYFTTVVYIGTAYLQMKNKYLLPALTGVALNSIIIFSIFLGSKFNLLILPLGSVLGLAIQALIISSAMSWTGFKYQFIFNHKDNNIKEIVFLAIPLMVGTSVNQINVLVDRTISSRIMIGGISSLMYANRLIIFIQTLFIATIVTVLYPKITRLAALNKMEDHGRLIEKSLIYIFLILLPITVGAMIFSEVIIKFVYGRGAFDETSIKITSEILFYYSIGLTSTGFREVLLRAFYSMGDTKNSTKNATISVCLNIILNIILSKYLGIKGLALGTSISAIFCVVLLFFSLRKKTSFIRPKVLIITFIKILTASLIMGALAKNLFNKLLPFMNQNYSFIIAVIISIIVYFTVISFMKIKELSSILKVLKITKE